MSAVLEWYALDVRQRTEHFTAQLLHQKGYKPFLPTYLLKRRWRDRVKVLNQPLFSGYLFCRFDPLVRLPVLTTPGVISIVGGKEPSPVPEREIEAVWKIVNSAVSAEPWPYLRCGDSVTISEGPLRGVEGILAVIKNVYKVVVSINLLQRSVAAEVDRALVLPLNIARHLSGRVIPSTPQEEVGVSVE